MVNINIKLLPKDISYWKSVYDYTIVSTVWKQKIELCGIFLKVLALNISYKLCHVWLY